MELFEICMISITTKMIPILKIKESCFYFIKRRISPSLPNINKKALIYLIKFEE